VKAQEKRFQILVVNGFQINPNTWNVGGTGRPMGATYAVCDSHREWQEVGFFASGVGRSVTVCRERAEALQAELNAEEEAAAA
jgi:hypothetical protein